jgi:hypothetical protein
MHVVDWNKFYRFTLTSAPFLVGCCLIALRVVNAPTLSARSLTLTSGAVLLSLLIQFLPFTNLPVFHYLVLKLMRVLDWNKFYRFTLTSAPFLIGCCLIALRVVTVPNLSARSLTLTSGLLILTQNLRGLTRIICHGRKMSRSYVVDLWG